MDTAPVRTFSSMRSANAALIQWLKGKHVCSSGYYYSSGEYYEETEIVPVPARIKDEMEIVSIHLYVTS